MQSDGSTNSMKRIMKKTIILLTITFGILYSVDAQQTLTHYLSGTDKDHTIEWDFFCTKGQNSGRWTTIAVPSNWELHSFGNYTYGNGYNNDKEGRSDELGLYKYSFDALSQWEGKKIFIVFEGSMTDTEVKINGHLAGPVHQGGFYEFRYDVTDLIQMNDSNLLEVTVSKQSQIHQ